jgi:hypothetical protein
MNGIKATDNVRSLIKRYIKPLCKEHGVTREDIGIIAGARATMYYRGQFKAVSFFEVANLAMNGTDVVYIEKMGMVEVYKDFADEKRIALVNSQGQFTDYAKELAALARKSGGHVFVMADMDLAGIIMAATLGPDVPWIGINNDWIEHFSIPLPTEPDPDGSSVKKYRPGEHRRVVVPLYLKSKPKEKEKLRRLIEKGINEIKDEETGEIIEIKDTRFIGKVDLDWLWTKDIEIKKKNGKKGVGVEGHRIEIDGIKNDQGNRKTWQFMLQQMEKLRSTRNYKRVISTDSLLKTPEASTLYFSYNSAVVDKLNDHIKNKAEEIAKDKRVEIEKQLENYPGFVPTAVSDLEYEKRRELEEAVHKEKETQDIHSVCTPVLEEAERSIEEKIRPIQQEIDELQAEIDGITDSEVEELEQNQIIPAVKKLEQEKGYKILDDSDGHEEGGSQNSKDNDASGADGGPHDV